MILLANKADRDLRAAEVLLERSDADFFCAIICFHCQQSIEKYLKAFLTCYDCHVSKTHDLQYLAILCSDFDHHFKGYDLSDFRDYGVGIRYEDFMPNLNEAKEAVKTAKEITDYIKKKLIAGVIEPEDKKDEL